MRTAGPLQRPSKEEDQFIRYLYTIRKFSLSKVAQEIGHSSSYVNTRLDRMGIEKRCR
jgi:hypothetical protein